MTKKVLTGKRVLITGGTSGLGKSLAFKFLERGCEVVVLGKRIDKISKSGLKAIYCDLAQLRSVVEVVEEIDRQKLKFDFLVNNAGILSPPTYSETTDGFEISYQVNFLSHILLTRLLQRLQGIEATMIINVSSPIYRRGILDNDQVPKRKYSALQAYANSKLYLALFSKQLAGEGIRAFSFDPGTFSSGIYRSQNSWFHYLYRFAAPFMVSSESVANKLLAILENDHFSSGVLIGKKGAEKLPDHLNEDEIWGFWQNVNRQINGYVVNTLEF